MPFVSSRVDVTTSFDRVSREVNQHAKRAVEIAAIVGARVAGAAGAERGLDSPVPEPARGTADGWIATFTAPGIEQGMQNWGTLGNRRKALKQPPRTNRTRAPGTGITPLGHLDAGIAAGRKAMQAELRRGAV